MQGLFICEYVAVALDTGAGLLLPSIKVAPACAVNALDTGAICECAAVALDTGAGLLLSLIKVAPEFAANALDAGAIYERAAVTLYTVTNRHIRECSGQGVSIASA